MAKRMGVDFLSQSEPGNYIHLNVLTDMNETKISFIFGDVTMAIMDIILGECFKDGHPIESVMSGCGPNAHAYICVGTQSFRFCTATTCTN